MNITRAKLSDPIPMPAVCGRGPLIQMQRKRDWSLLLLQVGTDEPVYIRHSVFYVVRHILVACVPGAHYRQDTNAQKQPVLRQGKQPFFVLVYLLAVRNSLCPLHGFGPLAGSR